MHFIVQETFLKTAAIFVSIFPIVFFVFFFRKNNISKVTYYTLCIFNKRILIKSTDA